jgi:hypothetical protein
VQKPKSGTIIQIGTTKIIFHFYICGYQKGDTKGKNHLVDQSYDVRVQNLPVPVLGDTVHEYI